MESLKKWASIWKNLSLNFHGIAGQTQEAKTKVCHGGVSEQATPHKAETLIYPQYMGELETLPRGLQNLPVKSPSPQAQNNNNNNKTLKSYNYKPVQTSYKWRAQIQTPKWFSGQEFNLKWS